MEAMISAGPEFLSELWFELGAVWVVQPWVREESAHFGRVVHLRHIWHRGVVMRVKVSWWGSRQTWQVHVSGFPERLSLHGQTCDTEGGALSLVDEWLRGWIGSRGRWVDA